MRFYLPDGWQPDPDQTYDESYLMSKVHTIVPGAALETDNDGQIVIYTGLMLDNEEIVAPLAETPAGCLS